MTRRWRWLAAGGLVLALAGLAANSLRGKLVDVVEVRAAPLVRTLQFSARVTTLSRVDVGSTLTGRVTQVLVREGQPVRQGEALVRLESDELQAALGQALAGERQAQARLEGLRTSGRLLAQAGVVQAEATVLAARAEMERAQQLVAQGFVSASRLDDARRASEVALAQQSGARAQAQANADTGTDVAQAQAQLALARAATTAAQARLAQTVIRAPAPARVLSREVEPGQIVQAGRALIGLALAGPTQLKAQVDERFLEQLQQGQAAQVVADAFPGQRFAAQVASIAPAVDAQRGAVEVKLVLTQAPPAFLREDMTLSVEVETARRTRALALPLAVLRGPAQDSTAQVLLSSAGQAQARTVRLGLRTLEAVEVLEGLTEGETVVTSRDVQAGERVRPRLVATWPAAATPVQEATAAKASGGGGSGGAAALTNAMGR